MQKKREWDDLMVGGWSNQITGFLRAGPSFSKTERAQILAKNPRTLLGPVGLGHCSGACFAVRKGHSDRVPPSGYCVFCWR